MYVQERLAHTVVSIQTPIDLPGAAAAAFGNAEVVAMLLESVMRPTQQPHLLLPIHATKMAFEGPFSCQATDQEFRASSHVAPSYFLV
jgi:hypothetical protein